MIIPRMPSARSSTVPKSICRLLLALAGTGSGAVAKLCQQLPVVLEIDPQHDRNAEDELSMGHGIENVVGDLFPELSASVGRAIGVIASFMESCAPRSSLCAVPIHRAHHWALVFEFTIFSYHLTPNSNSGGGFTNPRSQCSGNASTPFAAPSNAPSTAPR